jgi:hypothetical protein
VIDGRYVLRDRLALSVQLPVFGSISGVRAEDGEFGLAQRHVVEVVAAVLLDSGGLGPGVTAQVEDRTEGQGLSPVHGRPVGMTRIG